MDNRFLNLIVAVDNEYGIGKNNTIPWYIPNDLKFFRKITDKSIIIMGRKTWDSIKNKPLKDRINVVLSNTLQTDGTFDVINDLKLFLSKKYEYPVYIIGGSYLYNEVLSNFSNLIKTIYITHINNNYNCDTFFSKEHFNHFITNNIIKTEDIEHGSILEKDNTITYTIKKYSICNNNSLYTYQDLVNICKTYDIPINEYCSLKIHEEYKYLNLLKKIINEDKIGRQTRNAKTYSIFGPQIDFDISKSFPLLTTKKMFWKGIVEELLFFIRGQTNSKILSDKKIKIWEPNTTKEFLQSRNLDYEEGYMGPMYGFVWRHYGADYGNGKDDFIGKGYDQLYNLIKDLTNDPHSRRLLLTTYQPDAVCKSVLAPCHGIVIQFYVDNGNLDCKMYQRSVDTVCGLPFNIASYALFTYMIAYVCGLKPRKLIMTFGDVHIYEQHINAVNEQLKREPYEFPTLKINKKFEGMFEGDIEGKLKFLEQLEMNDFELQNYNSHPLIKVDMVA